MTDGHSPANPLHPREAAARTRARRLARRHRGRRFLALAAAVAVPAFAAPAQWHSFTFASEAEAKPAVTPMAFETPGESFPGSAFYYLADQPYVPLGMEQPDTPMRDTASLAAARPDPLVGPAASPLVVGGSATDQARALQCMTMAIYYEAASEPDAGQRAVAQVVMNRVAHPSYPGTVCGVVFQGSERKTGCQFSFTCDGSLNRKPSRKFWDRARSVALAAVGGAVYRPVGLATHYHTVQIHPYWADSLDNVGTIGAHRFYRWKGAAGRSAAFSFAYRGGEPLAKRHTPTADAAANAATLDPLALARAFELAHPELAANAAEAQSAGVRPATQPKAPPPDYSDSVRARGGDAQFRADKLPQSGSVKEEFSQSGQWLNQP